MRVRASFVIVMLAVVAAAVVAFGLAGVTTTDLRHVGEARNAVAYGGAVYDVPEPEPADGRVLPQVTPSTRGNYAFMVTGDDGNPVLYDPCRPISYVVNPAGAPPRGDELVQSAIQRVSKATGLAFEYGGTTDERASEDRQVIQVDRYGERYAPVLFGWSTESETPALAGSITGLGGSKSVPGVFGDQRYLAAGVVILDANDLATLSSNERDFAIATAVVMHEVAHVIGLAHVDDDSEIMNASNTYLSSWGNGDLQGLALAGAGVCEQI